MWKVFKNYFANAPYPINMKIILGENEKVLEQSTNDVYIGKDNNVVARPKIICESFGY